MQGTWDTVNVHNFIPGLAVMMTMASRMTETRADCAESELPSLFCLSQKGGLWHKEFP